MNGNRIEDSLDDFPVPPAELHALISGNPDLNVSDYFETGRACASTVSGILSRNGVDIRGLGTILDFGCGAGRVIRHFRALKAIKLYGTDINPALADWCRTNLPFAEFAVNQPYPPLVYANETFDLVYAFSVFTHLPEALQLVWLDELSRVLKPNGYLVMTTHGEAYTQKLSQLDTEKFHAGQLVVYNESSAGDPSAYGQCNAFHPQEYVNRKLANGVLFDLIDFMRGQVIDAQRGLIGQDVYLLRKPSHRASTPRHRGRGGGVGPGGRGGASTKP